MAEGGGLDGRWQWLSQRICNYFKTTPDRFQALVNKDECRLVPDRSPWGGLDVGLRCTSPAIGREATHRRLRVRPVHTRSPEVPTAPIGWPRDRAWSGGGLYGWVCTCASPTRHQSSAAGPPSLGVNPLRVDPLSVVRTHMLTQPTYSAHNANSPPPL